MPKNKVDEGKEMEVDEEEKGPIKEWSVEELFAMAGGVGGADEEEEKEDEKDQEEDENKPKAHVMKIAELSFTLGLGPDVLSEAKRSKVEKELKEVIKKNDMAPYYLHACKTFGWQEDAKLTKAMQKKNAEKLEGLEKKRTEALEHAGDAEVRDAMLEAAAYLADIGDKEKALEQYEKTLEKTIGAGSRIDIVLAEIRLAMLFFDKALVKEKIDQAKGLVEAGGDWERRNVLGVYQAMHLIVTRNWQEAVKLLLKSVSTFTASELVSFEELVFATVLLAVTCIDRTQLKKDVVKSPDVLSVLSEVPNLQDFLFSFYNCQYSTFFEALAKISDQVKTSMFFSTHTGFFLREVRIVAYTQFLQSYRSVTFASMAQAFGVSTEFLDQELSRFIAAGRLNCKIDKVAGIVVTNRPDQRNQQYQEMIKHGDALLHRVQKLSQTLLHLR